MTYIQTKRKVANQRSYFDVVVEMSRVSREVNYEMRLERRGREMREV